jgi:hypothetical protein
MSPLADAVRFVDGEERDLEAVEPLWELFEPLRCNVEEFDLTRGHSPPHGTLHLELLG